LNDSQLPRDNCVMEQLSHMIAEAVTQGDISPERRLAGE